MVIELRSVTHRFGDRTVLKEVDLVLAERRIAVIGANGSGKSTFARLLNGLLLPSQGSVRIDGIDTREHGKEVRRKVGFVFQNPDNQIVFPVVEEDLAFGLKNLKLSREEVRARVDRALEQYGLAEYRNHPAHLLSGGQKQLLAISAVLVMEPNYVVFDEPTTALDLRNKRKITRFIHELAQASIVVSHDLDLLSDFDRVIAFDEGRVVLDGSPRDVIGRYIEMME
ncbi:energy-coupling factor ABC transporter ATP-binding protein [Mesorhizobium sp. 1B3]|uniref:energy-coupling factor ABC transporter ATP-binding protein n=1 Tax=Mesorhizobium sp. 1B3 TaxID=3243599 RepID=UPI003D998221